MEFMESLDSAFDFAHKNFGRRSQEGTAS
jgi:hypothetical protein